MHVFDEDQQSVLLGNGTFEVGQDLGQRVDRGGMPDQNLSDFTSLDEDIDWSHLKNPSCSRPPTGRWAALKG